MNSQIYLVKNHSEMGNKEKRELIYGLLFTAPAVLGFAIFTLGPMMASLILSFTDYAIVNKVKFIGIDNFIRLFNGTDPFFFKSLGVTTYYVLLSVPLGIIFAFFLALLLNQEIKGLAFFRTVFYLPSIVPVVASSMIWLWLLNPDLGLVNNVLRSLHLPTSQWIFSETAVIPSLVLMSLWTTGGTMVIFLAGLQDIPTQLYEAIDVDGGSKIHKLVYITIPLMTPTIFFNLVMGFIGGFQVFSQAFIMTQGGPNNASLFYVFYLYREAFTFSRMGSACAIAWILFIIITIFTIIIFKTSKSWVYYEGEGRR